MSIQMNPLERRNVTMAIIDFQVHCYDANTPKRPWHTVPNWPDHATGDEMTVAMDRVGVAGAIVKPVDPDDPAVADVIADWKKTPGAVGIRIMMTKEAGRDPSDPGLDRIL